MGFQTAHRATFSKMIEKCSADHCAAVSAQLKNRCGPEWCHKLLEGDIIVVFPIEATFLGWGRIIVAIESGEFISQDAELEFISHMGEDWS